MHATGDWDKQRLYTALISMNTYYCLLFEDKDNKIKFLCDSGSLHHFKSSLHNRNLVTNTIYQVSRKWRNEFKQGRG